MVMQTNYNDLGTLTDAEFASQHSGTGEFVVQVNGGTNGGTDAPERGRLSQLALRSHSHTSAGTTFPASPQTGELFMFNSDVASLPTNVGYDYDGITALTSASQGDIFRYNGSRWVKVSGGLGLQQAPVGGGATYERRIFYTVRDTLPTFPAVTYTSPAAGFQGHDTDTGNIWLLSRYPTVIPSGDSVWFTEVTAVLNGSTWDIHSSPVQAVSPEYTLRWSSDTDGTNTSATFRDGTDNFVSYRQSGGTWGPWISITAQPVAWEHLWSNEATYDASNYTADVSPGINLDDFGELKFRVRNRNTSNELHYDHYTHSLRTEGMALINYNDTAYMRGNIIRLAIGGTYHASTAYLTNDLGQYSTWRQFEGIDIGLSMRREDGVTTGRTIGRFAFSIRIGAFNRSVIIDVYGR